MLNASCSPTSPAGGRLKRRMFACLVATIWLSTGCNRPERVAAGATLPDLEAVDQNGTKRTLSEHRGQPLVVYFYPKDGTPGCTEQACAFRDTWTKFEKAGVAVYGVSSDSQESKAAFAKEHELPFPILADPEHVWAEAFGVGHTFGLYDRVTFLLDKEGTVAKVYPDVDPAVNASEVLADATALK